MGYVQAIITEFYPRGAQVISHVWRPSLAAYEDTPMRVWEDHSIDGLMLCSEAEYATAVATGILPRRLITHLPTDLI